MLISLDNNILTDFLHMKTHTLHNDSMPASSAGLPNVDIAFESHIQTALCTPAQFRRFIYLFLSLHPAFCNPVNQPKVAYKNVVSEKYTKISISQQQNHNFPIPPP